MIPDTTLELENLKNENLELKLSAIRKEMSTLKVDLHRHLDMIIDKIGEVNEKVSLTNGSVAKVTERTNQLERQDNKAKIEKLEADFLQ